MSGVPEYFARKDPFAYFDNISAKRAELLSVEEQLAGQTLLSAETVTDSETENIFVWIQEHFEDFLRFLRLLSEGQQETILAYYLCYKAQKEMAVIFTSTQTVCSFHIRSAMRAFGAIIRFGGKNPSLEQLREVFKKADCERASFKSLKNRKVSLDLATVLLEYFDGRSFQKIAEKRRLHRAGIRRVLSRVCRRLRDSKSLEDKAVGAWMFSFLDEANPAGTGWSLRKIKKIKNKELVIPDIVGSFRVSLGDPDVKSLFTSRAMIKGTVRFAED